MSNADFVPCNTCPYFYECSGIECPIQPGNEEWSLGVGALESWALVKWAAEHHPNKLRELAVLYSKRPRP